MSYDAFISYAHRLDTVRATALQRALQNLAKPLYAWKALNIFRDQTSLSANPALWPSIESALEKSRFFVFMACPESADGSPWCHKEISWWLANRSPETFLIVLTGGELVFDENARDFDWTRTTSLPRDVIEGKFKAEPFYRDLRWAQQSDVLSLDNPQFRAAVLPLAATLHGKEPDTLDGEDLDLFRRTRRYRRWAVSALVLLTFASAYAAWRAGENSDEAENQRRGARKAQYAAEIGGINAVEARKHAEIQRAVAEKNEQEATRQRNLAEERYQTALGRQLAIQAEWARDARADQLPLSVLLAIEGMRRLPSIETEQALRAGLVLLPRLRWALPHPDPNTVDFKLGATGIRFTPDSKQVVTADGIWDVESGKPIAMLDHEGRSTAMALSADGSRVARGGGAGVVRAWNVAKGAPVTGILRVGVPITTVALSRDGELLAAGGQDNLVRVWNTVTGAPLKTLQVLPRNLSGEMNAIAFSPDGQHLAAARRNEVRLWDTRTWEPISFAISVASGSILSLAFSSDGQLIATVTPGEAQVWHRVDGVSATFSLGTAFGRPRAVVLSPDQGARYLGVTGNSSQVWEWKTKRRVAQQAHGGVIAFSPDSTRVATGGADNTARITSLDNGQEIARMAHDSGVLSASFSPNGRWLASASANGWLRLWGTDAGADLSRVDGKHARFIAGGRYSASITDDPVAWLWERESGRRVRVPAEGSPRSLLMSVDGTRVLTAAGDTVIVSELPSGRPINSLVHEPLIDWKAVQAREEIERKRSLRQVRFDIEQMQKHGSVTILAASTDARYVLTGRADEIARLWDVSRGQLTADYKEVDVAAFSPNGALLATAASRGEYARVWDSATGLRMAQLKASGDVDTLSFNRDGKYLLATGSSGALLWEARREQPIAVIAQAQSAKFDPTGRFLVTVESNRATLWDVRSGSVLQRLTCTCRMREVVFSPDGQHFVIPGNDGTVRIRALSANGTSRDLTQINAGEIAFSPDGALLVISEAEGDLTVGGTPTLSGASRVRVWEIRGRGEPTTIKQSTSIAGIVVSPDSRYIAGNDRVWEARTGREVTRVQGQIVAFSPDMSLLVANNGATSSIWIWRPDDLISVACAQVSRNLTQEEWRLYMGTEPYRKTCERVAP